MPGCAKSRAGEWLCQIHGEWLWHSLRGSSNPDLVGFLIRLNICTQGVITWIDFSVEGKRRGVKGTDPFTLLSAVDQG